MTAHLELLIEEDSAEAALREILPMILGDRSTFQIHTYQGKADLLSALPHRLRGYARWLPPEWKVVVLIDEDRGDCHGIKRNMESIARGAGLATKSNPSARGKYQVVNRIAIEELEAWFFGDVPALRAVYPRVPDTLASQANYRDPDGIKGGTWEALERILQKHGYHKGGMPKMAVAAQVAKHMKPSENRSKSFCVFRDGLLDAVQPRP
jgi:Domain of unknown function (DUF4276)